MKVRSFKKRLKDFLFQRLAKYLVEYLYSTPFLYGQCKIKCGKNVDLANTILNARSGKIVIGNNVIFGHDVMLLTGYHDYTIMDSFRVTLTNANRDIIIGDNAWIASGVIVLGSVSIGANSVIGAGSVITKDIPAGVLAAGIPAKVIRQLSLSEKIEA